MMIRRVILSNRKRVSDAANVLKYFSRTKTVKHKNDDTKHDFKLLNRYEHKTNSPTTRYQHRCDKNVNMKFIVDKKQMRNIDDEGNDLNVGPAVPDNNSKYNGTSIIAYCTDYVSYTTKEYAQAKIAHMHRSGRDPISELTSSLKGTGLGVIYNSKSMSRYNVECNDVDSLSLKEDTKLIRPLGIPLFIYPTERMKLVDFHSKVTEILTIRTTDESDDDEGDHLASLPVTFADHLQDYMEHFLCLVNDSNKAPRYPWFIDEVDKQILVDQDPCLSHDMEDFYHTLISARAYHPPHSKKAKRLTQALSELVTLNPNVDAVLATDNHVRRLLEDSLCCLPLPYGVNHACRRWQLMDMVEKAVGGGVNRDLVPEDVDSEDQQFVFAELTP